MLQPTEQAPGHGRTARRRPPGLERCSPRGGREGPEETVRLTIGARGEEQGVARSGLAVIAERQAPQTVDLEGFALGARELTGGREFVRSTLWELEGIDPAVAEVADQEVAA